MRLRRRLRDVAAAAALAAVAATAAACGSGSPAAAGKDPESGTVVVSAAASLTAGFKDLGAAYQKLHPAVKVQFNFAGSSTLVTQLANGAPADVFASADQANMVKAAKAGVLDGTAQVFARNRLAIVVPVGNPKAITGLKDLSRPGLRVSMCAPDVPIGTYARQAFAKAGAAVPRGGQELDVKQVVSRVLLGQADAGIVYTTDVKDGGPKVAGVPIPDAQNVIATYPMSLVKDGPDAELGRSFLAFVLSPQGQNTLAAHGFLPP
jgi:molybdate transport system substrate-binding protein